MAVVPPPVAYARSIANFVNHVEKGNVLRVAGSLKRRPLLAHVTMGWHRQTPLMLAARKGRWDVVKLLLEHGARVSAVDSQGCGALLHATLGGHAAVVSLLLAHGADPYVEALLHDAPLLEASKRGDLRVVLALLQYLPVAGLDRRGRCEKTALYHACEGGSAPVARALLLAGGDHRLVAYGGQTPRCAAVQCKRADCIAVLDWWEGQLSLGYELHRVVRLGEDHASCPTPLLHPCLHKRRHRGEDMPAVELIEARGGEEERPTKRARTRRLVKQEDEDEHNATLAFVSQRLSPDLYVELAQGLRLRERGGEGGGLGGERGGD